MITAGFIRNSLDIKSISAVKIIGPSERQQLPHARQSVAATASSCSSAISLSIFIRRCLFFLNHFSHTGFFSAASFCRLEISILFSVKVHSFAVVSYLNSYFISYFCGSGLNKKNNLFKWQKKFL